MAALVWAAWYGLCALCGALCELMGVRPCW